MGNLASCARPSVDSVLDGSESGGKAWTQQQLKHNQVDHKRAGVADTRGSYANAAADSEAEKDSCKPQQDAASEARAFLQWASGEAVGAQQTLAEFLSINTSVASACATNASSFTAAPSLNSFATSSANIAASAAASGSVGAPGSVAGSSVAGSSKASVEDCAASIHSSPTAAAGLHLGPYQPHDANSLGCPLPACHMERSETASAVNDLRATQDGDMESILAMVCVAFGVDTANIALLTGESITKCGACGVLKPGVSPTRWGFCGWSFINTHHELLVLENMGDDARVADNFFVTAPDYQLKFYVGAPLISSNGHRLGTLCLYGHKPGKFDATRAQLLANLSEMVIRQIEANWALQRQQQRDASQLARSLACYDMAYMLVDVAQPDWRVMYLNKPAQKQLGVEWKVSYDMLPIGTASTMRQKLDLPGVPLESYFDLQDTTTVWAPHGTAFSVKGAHGAAGLSIEGRSFTLEFRLATSDGLDSEQPFHVGVPAWLDEASDGFGQSLFFVQVREGSPSSVNSSGPRASSMLATWSQVLSGGESSRSFLPRGVDAEDCPVEGLVLGPLLGKGSYGRVYRGVYRGLPVAVKVIEDISKMRTTDSGEPLEAVLTRDVKHLGVMRTVTYAYCPEKSTCWMLFEYCDRTCIQDAVVKGWFRTNHQITMGTVDMRVVAITAYEVASAMAFLHKHDIVHGDLKGGNVMLCSSPLNPHGFTAKVGDFGLSRADVLGPQCPHNKYGTVTHMPPEVLLNGEVGKPTDVYSFGVMLWEMLTTARAWAGMRHTQIICQVALMQRQLAIPDGLPPPLESLLRDCLAPQVNARCTFGDVLATLSDFLQTSRDQDLSSVRLTLAQNGDDTWGHDACDSYGTDSRFRST